MDINVWIVTNSGKGIKMPDDFYHEYYECRCESPEHVLRFTYSEEEYYKPDEKEAVVYLNVFLSTGGFWHRVKEGVKYIFGHKSKYGHFDDWIMKREDAEKLRDLFNKVVEFNTPKQI